jgi:hypothetical protein
LRPSGARFDPDRAWTSWMEEAERAFLEVEHPITLIGSSFGAIPAELSSRFQRRQSLRT